MDFKMTQDRVKLRQEFFDFCAELEKERPERSSDWLSGGLSSYRF